MGWIARVSHLENEARQEMKMASGEKCELLPVIKWKHRDAILEENFVVKVARVDELNSRNKGFFCCCSSECCSYFDEVRRSKCTHEEEKEEEVVVRGGSCVEEWYQRVWSMVLERDSELEA
ncbi:hypothetical protein LINPERHAP1_LOCUS29334 [Linum perenne]